MIKFTTNTHKKGGIYRNIPFEVVKWQPAGSDTVIWNYYVYISSDIITNESKSYFENAEKITRRLYNYSILNDIIDMYGGITYMSIELHPKKFYKIGCDYNHLYDKETIKTFDIILQDVKHTIDKMYEKGVIHNKEA